LGEIAHVAVRIESRGVDLFEAGRDIQKSGDEPHQMNVSGAAGKEYIKNNLFWDEGRRVAGCNLQAAVKRAHAKGLGMMPPQTAAKDVGERA
jgi:hypothetical protein